ncbi:MAG: hypothetical protein D8M57_10370 [Candidatus Scalindua sp. AMX11]|nr:MAG: hypothetical protein DWQ00_01505 [Candidatus Scalindua sp.]TDE64993.1 MAG: hypothetical protein D8M57_10370 [Candidatus Scalindua sp. AMX11]
MGITNHSVFGRLRAFCRYTSLRSYKKNQQLAFKTMEKNTIPKSAFNTFFEQHNAFQSCGFSEWVFSPGMLYRDRNSWWKSGAIRPVPHEGIDLYLFRDKTGQICRLNGYTMIPVMYDGLLMHIHDDFLGKSLYVKHHISIKGQTLHTIYGHVVPEKSSELGDTAREGEIIATVASPSKKSAVPPHVHITMAWLPDTLSCKELNWETIGNHDHITLCNPLDFIDTYSFAS